MKIVLVKISSRGINNPSIGQPMGLMYLASYIRTRRKNLDTIKIFDSRAYGGLEKLLLVVKNENPDIIGLSCLSHDSHLQKQFSAMLKNTGYNGFIVAGGPYPTADPDGIFANGTIDIGVLGEGEETFLELINCIDTGKDISRLQGTVCMLNGKLIVNEPREFIKDLDQIPFPAWDLIDMEFYWKNYSNAPIGKRRYMQIITSRGCPFQCTFCHNILGKTFRARSPENVASEVDILFRKYKIRHFEIIDDIFNLDKERASNLLDAFISRNYNLRLSFPNGLRADILDLDLIKKLKLAGTNFVGIGIETASPRLQKFIRKKLDLMKVKEAISTLRKNGIFTNGFFIFGFPGETLKDIKETTEYANKSDLDAAQFFFLNPFKGAPIYDYIFSHSEPLVSSTDYGYHLTTANYSDIDDKVFFRYVRFSYIKFYFYRFRIIKSFLHYPNKIYFFHYALVVLLQTISHMLKLGSKKGVHC